MWESVDSWLKQHKAWLEGPFPELDAESVEQSAQTILRTLKKCEKKFEGVPGCLDVTRTILKDVSAFVPHVPLIIAPAAEGPARAPLGSHISQESGKKGPAGRVVDAPDGLRAQARGKRRLHPKAVGSGWSRRWRREFASIETSSDAMAAAAGTPSCCRSREPCHTKGDIETSLDAMLGTCWHRRVLSADSASVAQHGAKRTLGRWRLHATATQSS